MSLLLILLTITLGLYLHVVSNVILVLRTCVLGSCLFGDQGKCLSKCFYVVAGGQGGPPRQHSLIFLPKGMLSNVILIIDLFGI